MKKTVCILLSLVLILTGCMEERKSTVRDNRIICSFGELPPSLNMTDLDSRYYGGIYTYLFEGLVTMDRKGSIKPGLAEDWSVSKDGIGYTFNIRKDAKWSDGSTITSDDFVTFFKNTLFSNSKSKLAYDLFPVYGAEDYSKGRIKFDGAAIRSLDKSTLEIRLNKSCPDFLKILSQPQYGLRKDTELLKKWKTAYRNIKYSGAFIIDDIGKEGVTLTKNPSYWDSGNVTGERFLLTGGKSEEEAFADYEGNKINLLLNPPISEVGRVIESEDTMIINSEDVISLTFNSSNSRAAKDPDLRKSLIASINTDDLKEKYLGEFNPQEYDIFKTVSVFSGSNIKADEKYKKDDSSKNQVGKVSLVLMAVNDDIDKRLCKGIVKQLEDNLNVDVEIKYIVEEEFQSEVKKGDYDMLLSTVTGDYDKTLSLYKSLQSDSPSNFSGYKDKDLDDILKLERYTGDDNQKENYAKKCNELLAKSCIILPLFKKVDILLKSHDLDGIEVDPYNNIVINNVSRNQ